MYIVLILALLVPIWSEAQIEMFTPQDGEWTVAVDDLKDLPIKGKVSGLALNSKVNIKIRGQVWSGKTDSEGKFNILVDPVKIRPYDKTEVEVVALEDSKEKFKKTINVYCCSTEKYGFYKELTNPEINLMINKSGESIDGLAIKSLGELLPKNKTTKLVVGTETYMDEVPKQKYTPINSAVSIKYLPELTVTKPILYTFTFDLNTPRTRFGVKTTVKDWEYVHDKKWSNIDLNTASIVVLGHDPYSESKWIEIKPVKIGGNKVQIKVPSVNNYDRFIPVLVLEQKK